MKPSKSYIFCCDWGTSSFRLRLTDSLQKRVLDEIATHEGSSYVYDQWKNSAIQSEHQRFHFYLEYILKYIDTFAQTQDKDLSSVPIIISGMASSSIGMKELSYAHTPFSLDGSDIVSELIRDKNAYRKIILISGVRTDRDVMRGEEVQLIGMENLIRKFSKTYPHIIVLLPGTHSKHVYIKDQKIVDFGTFLTGEMFDLLSKNGLLKQSVVQSAPPEDREGWEYFRRGVRYSREIPLLQSLFSVRTNELFQKMSKRNNYYYMSGLLIGYELKGLRNRENSQIIACCPDRLQPFYKHALDELGLAKKALILASKALEQYTVEGQLSIATKFPNIYNTSSS